MCEAFIADEGVLPVVAKSVIETVREYAQTVNIRFPVKRVYLYGSHVRGTNRPDSDIDVAIVLREEPADVLKVEAELYRLGMDVDVRIEPIIIDMDHDPSGFYKEIARSGTVVYGSSARKRRNGHGIVRVHN